MALSFKSKQPRSRPARLHNRLSRVVTSCLSTCCFVQRWRKPSKKIYSEKHGKEPDFAQNRSEDLVVDGNDDVPNEKGGLLRLDNSSEDSFLSLRIPNFQRERNGSSCNSSDTALASLGHSGPNTRGEELPGIVIEDDDEDEIRNEKPDDYYEKNTNLRQELQVMTQTSDIEGIRDRISTWLSSTVVDDSLTLRGEDALMLQDLLDRVSFIPSVFDGLPQTFF